MPGEYDSIHRPNMMDQAREREFKIVEGLIRQRLKTKINPKIFYTPEQLEFIFEIRWDEVEKLKELLEERAEWETAADSKTEAVRYRLKNIKEQPPPPKVSAAEGQERKTGEPKKASRSRTHRQPIEHAISLSPAEHMMFNLIVDGRSNNEIAQVFGIGINSAGVKKSQLLGRLGIAGSRLGNNREDLISLARKLGMLAEDSDHLK